MPLSIVLQARRALKLCGQRRRNVTTSLSLQLSRSSLHHMNRKILFDAAKIAAYNNRNRMEATPLGAGPGTSAILDPTTKASWDVLPPHSEIVEGCRVFWTHFFQLGG